MQRRFPTRLLGLLGLSAVLAGCGPQDPMAEVSTSLTQGVIVPTHEAWLASDRALASSAQAFCTGQASLEQARQAFFDAQAAWSRLQPVTLGPLGEGNLAWQVQFWPDKKNLVARQVNALMKQHPQLTRAQVETGSVVVQGLTAYEYLLFDPALDMTDAATRERFCPLLTAIGAHQQALAEKVVQQWQGQDGMAAQLTQLPSTRYADSHEAIGDILRMQVTALDGLKKKLGLPLGRPGQGIAQPYQAEAWRSGASLANIAATVEGARALWQGKDDNGLRSLLGSAHHDLAERINAAYRQVEQQLGAVQQPMAELLDDPAGRERLNALYASLDALHRLHQGELAKALGVQIGFNAHDGD